MTKIIIKTSMFTKYQTLWIVKDADDIRKVEATLEEIPEIIHSTHPEEVHVYGPQNFVRQFELKTMDKFGKENTKWFYNK